MIQRSIQQGPLVSVLMSTYNRPDYVGLALESILRQTYENFEVVLVRDGGLPVDHVVSQYSDPRIVFINRDENRGLPTSFNEALSVAQGKYICYLGDDDIFYPHHIETLVDALEAEPHYQAAYTDLYKAHCKVLEDGTRLVLSKNIEVSRDYDRMLMLQFNHALHVSLMHRKDLFEKIGGYNEKLNVLIDWDLTRKLCFYTDFKHIPVVTGEFYAPIEDNDRISVQRRKKFNEFIVNLLTIRSTRPPKPWTKIDDLSIVIMADRVDDALTKLINDIWSHSYYPHQIYLPLPESQISQLRTMVPNVLGVAVQPNSGETEKIEAVLKVCEGRYIGVVPFTYSIHNDECMWIEKALNALIQCDDPTQAFELHESSDQRWAAVFRKEQLNRIRHLPDSLSIRDAIRKLQIKMRKPTIDEYPFQLDHMLKMAEEFERQGDWLQSAAVYKYMIENYGNECWLKIRYLNSLYYAGHNDEAIILAEQINQCRPSVSTLLLEAKLRKQKRQYQQAIDLFCRAEDMLTGKHIFVSNKTLCHCQETQLIK